MDNYVLDIQKKFSEELGRAAHEYLEIGLDMFHNYRRSKCSSEQVAVGNLATAVELMIKSFIASKNFGCIFKGIPPELRVLLSNPESIPQFFEWRNYDIDIHSDKYETLDFNDCIASFYIFFPQLKQIFMPHINFLSRWKNASLKGTLPAFNMYEFERIGFAVLNIVISLINDNSFPYSWYTLTDDDKNFIQDFESKCKERVQLAIIQAKQNMSKITSDQIGVIVANNWETLTFACPVCKINGLLKGYTELSIGKDEDGPYPALDFFATSFHCEECCQIQKIP